jgi:hypothetical protein
MSTIGAGRRSAGATTGFFALLLLRPAVLLPALLALPAARDRLEGGAMPAL